MSSNSRKRKRQKVKNSPPVPAISSVKETKKPLALVAEEYTNSDDSQAGSPQIPPFEDTPPQDGTSYSFSDVETTKQSPETPFTPDFDAATVPELKLAPKKTEKKDEDNKEESAAFIQSTTFRRGAQRSKIHTKLGGQRRTWASTIKVKSDVPPITERRFEVKCNSCKAELEYGINDITVRRPNPVYQVLGYEAEMIVQCPVCTNDVDVKEELPEWLKKKL